MGVGILALIEHSHKEPEEGQKNLNLRSKNSDIDKYYLRCVGRPELLTRDDELYHGRRIMAEKEIHSTIKDVLLYLEDLVQEGHIDSSFLVGYRNGDTHSFFTQKARDIISLEQKLENCKVYRGKQAENIKANIISNLDEMVPQEFLKDLFWHSLENKQNDVYSYIMRDYESCMNNASLSTVIQEAQKHALMSSDKMVEANIRYVVKIVNRYIDNKLDFLELVQEGTIGITIAADRFDYTKGFKFSTYATWWIRQSITRFILDTERTVRVPVHLQEKIRQINRVRAVEYMKKGVLPEDCEVAQKLHIGADLVEDYSRSIFSTETRSFVTQTEDGQESDLDPPDPDAIMGYDIIHRNDVSRFIWAGISKLDPREQQVLCMRFGLGPCSKYGLREDATTLMTLKQVGNLYGLTRERIRQIEYFALKKLKHTYNNKPFQELY